MGGGGGRRRWEAENFSGSWSIGLYSFRLGLPPTPLQRVQLCLPYLLGGREQSYDAVITWNGYLVAFADALSYRLSGKVRYLGGTYFNEGDKYVVREVRGSTTHQEYDPSVVSSK